MIDLHKDEERIRVADEAAFDRAMHSCENDGPKAANFGILCNPEKASDARLIAQHSECPAEVRASVEGRTAKAAASAAPAAPAASAAKTAGPTDDREARPEG